ncbi:hypothetical protein DACRYDRAFT_108341 [Dacryopinax primogenitus]|uniref:Uncharacterized protein n=1 Tax=Dacryopinax primogenitus (strain DJM 731) TaxID=1858805 RepID=M5G5A2_DACPD|nr:uncharacterized protein DACRYDRAFT_108341 [Dacryopinax primogenitus]EJU01007.1 hypothetical protein DACRYDRAFT_108341 [Dacryopinax primogenitus]
MAKAASSPSFNPTAQRDAFLQPSIPASVTLLISAPMTMTPDRTIDLPSSLLYNTATSSSPTAAGSATGSVTPPYSSLPPPTPTPGIPTSPSTNDSIPPGPNSRTSEGQIPPWAVAMVCIIIGIVLLLSIVVMMWLYYRRQPKVPPYKVQMQKSLEKGSILPVSDTLTPLNPRASVLISAPKPLEKRSTARDGQKRSRNRPGTADSASIGKRVVDGLTSVARSHVPPKLVISRPIPVPNIVLEPPTPSSSIFTGLSTLPSSDCSGLLEARAREDTDQRDSSLLEDGARPARHSKRASIHVYQRPEGEEAYELVRLQRVKSLAPMPDESLNKGLAISGTVHSHTGPSITVTKDLEEVSFNPEVWDGYQDYLEFAGEDPSLSASPRDMPRVKSREDRLSTTRSASSIYSDVRSPNSVALSNTPNEGRLLHSSSVFERVAGWKDGSDVDTAEEDLSDLSFIRPVLSSSPSTDTSSSVNMALWELVLGHGSITSLNDLTKTAKIRKSRLSEISTVSQVLQSPSSPTQPGLPHSERDAVEDSLEEPMSPNSRWSFLDDLEGDVIDEERQSQGTLTITNMEDVSHVHPLRIAKRAQDGAAPYSAIQRPLTLPKTAVDDEIDLFMPPVPELEDSLSGDYDNSTAEDHMPSSPPPADILEEIFAGLSSFDNLEDGLKLQPRMPTSVRLLKPSRIPIRRVSKRRSALGNVLLTPKAEVYLRSAIPSPAYSTSVRPRRARRTSPAGYRPIVTAAGRRVEGNSKRRSSLLSSSLYTANHSGMKAYVLGRRTSVTRKASGGQASYLSSNNTQLYGIDIPLSQSRI